MLDNGHLDHTKSKRIYPDTNEYMLYKIHYITCRDMIIWPTAYGAKLVQTLHLRL